MSIAFKDLQFSRPEFSKYLAKKRSRRFEKVQWSLRPYGDVDEQAVTALYQKCFSEKLNREEWQWKYRRNPCGEPLILVAEDSSTGRLIGHAAAIPCRIKIGSHEETAYLLVDTMVDRIARGHGLHGHLTAHLCDQVFKKNGLPLGLPNEKAHNKGLIQGGAGLLTTLQVYLRIFRNSSLLKKHIGALSYVLLLVGKFEGLRLKTSRNALKVERVHFFGSEVDDLWGRIRNKFQITSVRTAERLNWRYFQNPSADYNVYAVLSGEKWLGYAVTKIDTKEGFKLGMLVDLFFDPAVPDAGKALLAQSCSHWKKEEIDIGVIVFSGPEDYGRLFRKAGFLKNRWKQLRQFRLMADFLGMKNCESAAIKRHENTLISEKNWLWNLGDSDII